MSFTNRLKKSLTFISLILTSYSLTACSNQGNQDQVSIDGAAVGFPISLAVAEEYHKQNDNAVVSVASSGTGGGVSKFCAGEIDIVAASRTIKDEEVAKCKKKNIEFVELPIALDGIAVIVNRQNDFAKCLSIILGISRAVGETMTVVIAAGQQPRITVNLLESVETMTAYMAQISGGDSPRGSVNFKTLYAVGAVLFILTLILNIVSYWISNRFKEKYD